MIKSFSDCNIIIALACPAHTGSKCLDPNLLNGDSSDYMARFNDNGSNQFFYDGSKKLETTSTGVTVTGSLKTTATGGGTGVLMHTNSGISINSNLMQFWTGQTSGYSFYANATGDGTNELFALKEKYIEAQKSLKPLFYENIQVVTPIGHKAYLSGWLIPKVSDEQFNGMTCTIRDTTRSQELSMLLKMSLDNSPDAIGITKQTEPGVYANTYFANIKMRQLFGQEDIGQTEISIQESLDRCKKFIVNKKEWWEFLQKNFTKGTKGSLLIQHTNGRQYSWTSENLLSFDGKPWGRMAVVKEVGRKRRKRDK